MPLVSYDIENHRLEPAANSTVAEIEESLEEAQRLFALFLMVFYIVFVFLVSGAVTLGIYICIERLVHSRRRRKYAHLYDELPAKFPKRIMEGKWFYKQSDSASTEELNSEEAYELMVAEGLAVPEEAHIRQPRCGARDTPLERCSITATDSRCIPRQQDCNTAYITDEDPGGSLIPELSKN